MLSCLVAVCPGAASVHDHVWKCNVCNFQGKWNHANDTLEAHFESRSHATAKASTTAEGGKLKLQKGIVGLFAAQVQKDEGKGVEPVKHPSSSPMFQVPMVERRNYFEKHRCHGFNMKSVSYGDVQHSVEPLLLDLEPGATWYPDPEYVELGAALDSSKLVKGTFRHRACQGFDCQLCPTIPRENDFRMRVLRESEAQLKRGTRICTSGVKYSVLQR